jgi:hypothetical protein
LRELEVRGQASVDDGRGTSWSMARRSHGIHKQNKLVSLMKEGAFLVNLEHTSVLKLSSLLVVPVYTDIVRKYSTDFAMKSPPSRPHVGESSEST